MKLTLTGLLFELEKINFRVGSVLKITFYLDDLVVDEKVRSIKHYDRFFRTPPKKKKAAKSATDDDIVAEDPAQEPKRLVETHFVQLKEENRRAIMKFLMSLTVQQLKKPK